jgi:hypothetical protein
MLPSFLEISRDSSWPNFRCRYGEKWPYFRCRLTDVVAIAAGDSHILAMKSDGTVWALGGNWSGQLGDATRTSRTTPVQVVGLDNVIAIEAGRIHSLAIKSDGTVWAWGNNSSGQLGDGSTVRRDAPVKVLGLGSATSVSAGDTHSVALISNGQVWTWGDNRSGQLGVIGMDESLVPVQSIYTSNITNVSAGYTHTVAIAEIPGPIAAPVANVQNIATQEDSVTPITLTASSTSERPLIYSIENFPTYGFLTGSAPNVEYTPNANWHGTDYFVFVVNDGTLGSDRATVTIDVASVNDAPVAESVWYEMAMNISASMTLEGSDPEGEALSYSIVTNPQNGFLSGNAPAVIYTPVANYSGPDSFTFRVTDSSGGVSEPATIFIQVTPVAVASEIQLDGTVDPLVQGWVKVGGLDPVISEEGMLLSDQSDTDSIGYTMDIPSSLEEQMDENGFVAELSVNIEESNFMTLEISLPGATVRAQLNYWNGAQKIGFWDPIALQKVNANVTNTDFNTWKIVWSPSETGYGTVEVFLGGEKLSGPINCLAPTGSVSRVSIGGTGSTSNTRLARVTVKNLTIQPIERLALDGTVAPLDQGWVKVGGLEPEVSVDGLLLNDQSDSDSIGYSMIIPDGLESQISENGFVAELSVNIEESNFMTLEISLPGATIRAQLNYWNGAQKIGFWDPITLQKVNANVTNGDFNTWKIVWSPSETGYGTVEVFLGGEKLSGPINCLAPTGSASRIFIGGTGSASSTRLARVTVKKLSVTPIHN